MKFLRYFNNDSNMFITYSEAVNDSSFHILNVLLNEKNAKPTMLS